MTLAQIAENQPAVKLLQRSLERDRLGHAYLFTGGDLTELEQVAQALAKTLNCQDPAARTPSGAPLDACDRCLSCRKIDAGTHADVVWVRPESKSRVVTVAQMRELMQTVHLTPTEAPWKVSIIVAADRLNVQAANAFLKTLEEPPANSVLVLLSTDPRQVLETILSRCLRLNLGGGGTLAAGAAKAEWLKSFSELAGSKTQSLLGRYRLLTLLLAELGRVKARIEKDLGARSPLERYEDADPKIRERWEEELEAAIEAEYRRQRTEVLAWLEWWLRDVWMCTHLNESAVLQLPDLRSSTAEVARRITPDDAVQNLGQLERTQWLLGSNVQEALALEVTLLKLKL